MSLYTDDPDEGLSPRTSHPRFVELAPESFFDESDDFSPFGNDDGNDALRDLEEWLEEEGADADPLEMLKELLEGWDLGVPDDVLGYSAERLIAFCGQDDLHERYVTAHANASIAVALGQLKIVGDMGHELVKEGLAGVAALRVLAEDTSRYPDWPHRGTALAALTDIDCVLRAVRQ